MNLFIALIRNDFKQNFAGSYFGIVWAFLQPIATILIFWFVFQVGFKAQPVSSYPFILWLLAGMIPWFFFSEGVSQGTSSVVNNSYLVKKIPFNVSLLPIIKLTSSLFIHIFFIVVMICIFCLYGYKIDIYFLQLIYYVGALILFIYAITLITSTLSVFAKDINPLVTMLLQFAFWLTPIFWNIDTVPEKYKVFIELNPLVYIIDGYRDVFINKIWFWDKITIGLYFWIVTILLLLIGKLMYTYLRPQFSDVL